MGDSFLDRFWARVDVRGPNECWPWKAGKTSGGYGAAYVRRNLQVPAHRLSWELTFATEVPAGLFACHRCDVRACANPAHIFLGTARDNTLDAARKGRLAKKLTDDDVAELRSMHTSGATSVELGVRFGINRSAAWKIAMRRERKRVA